MSPKKIDRWKITSEKGKIIFFWKILISLFLELLKKWINLFFHNRITDVEKSFLIVLMLLYAVRQKRKQNFMKNNKHMQMYLKNIWYVFLKIMLKDRNTKSWKYFGLSSGHNRDVEFIPLE